MKTRVRTRSGSRAGRQASPVLLLRFCVAVALGLASGFAAIRAVAAERPNFVFILVDDLGYMDVGCNNPKCFYRTPHIDRLAASGMRFTDGYAANPVCSPTRYSILTGKYPSRVDATNFFTGRRGGRFRPAVLRDHMPLKEVTLAEALRARGYRTFFAGKWHLGPRPEFWPRRQGFEVNRGGFSRGGPYGGNKYFSPYGNPRLDDGPPREHLADRLATETSNFIRDHRDQPFLAYLAFYSVHTPLIARPELEARYRAAAKRLAGQPEFAEEEQVLPIKRPRRVRILQRHTVYAAMVEAMDAAVGKVLRTLDTLGLSEKTVVMLTSDNGGLSTSEGSPTSNLPFRGGKGWLYEGGIREPFLIRWPGSTAPGSVCQEPVISTDFFPTIIEIAGTATHNEPPVRDGVSLVPLLTSRRKSLERDALYWHYPHYSNQGGFPGGAVRQGDWKLIERFEDGRTHLYHLGDDPGERQDLAAKHPDRVRALRGKLHRWYRQVDAKFLRAKPGGPEPWRPPTTE